MNNRTVTLEVSKETLEKIKITKRYLEGNIYFHSKISTGNISKKRSKRKHFGMS